MKYALFEFISERSCEVGETRWIIREDPKTFNNCSNWQMDKEVMVLWPREFSKVSRKIIKTSIDPDSVETTTCLAKVLRFSDDYEDIRERMKAYCETGFTNTHQHGSTPTGRGQRKTKKNQRFLESGDDEETSLKEKAPKKQKKHQIFSGPAKNAAVEKLKEKYDLMKTPSEKSELDLFDDEDEANSSDDEEADIRKQNAILQNKLEEKEKEIVHLHNVIKNLKHIPSLQDVLLDLKTQVAQLDRVNSIQHPVTVAYSTSGSSSSPRSSPSPCPSPQPCPSPHSSESDLDPELITIFANISVTKGQFKVLKTKINAKDFVYALMSMLWSREVLFTHSISGKSSNAYKEKDAKTQLDAEKVKSICEFASKKYGCSELDIRQIMISRINNVVKVIKAKHKLGQS